MTEIALPKKTPVKAAIAGWTGTMLEYYDFAVYGTSAALILNVLFFSPELPQGVSVLLSMITLAVGYAVRPLGSLILGPLGDRFGRKFVMMITLFGIGGCTFLIGCLPTYAQIGTAAPILLVLIRVVQGLCLSGEQPSAITMSLEHASERRRGFLTSFTTLGSASGTLLTLLVFIPIAAMPSEQLLTWGWRLPFWFSAIVVVVAYLMVTLPLLARRLRRGPIGLVPSGGFDLGRWGLPVNLFAAAWGVLVVLNTAWPRAEVYGEDGPRRYLALIATAAMLAVGGAYRGFARHSRDAVLEEHRAPSPAEACATT